LKTYLLLITNETRFHKSFQIPDRRSSLDKKSWNFSATFFIIYILAVVAYLVAIFVNFGSYGSDPLGSTQNLTILIALIVVLGGLILTPFILYFCGYEIEIVRNVMNGDKKNLPELNPIGDKIIIGFKYMVAAIPQVLIMLIAVIPLVLLTEELIYSTNSPQMTIQIIFLVIYSFLFLCLSFLWGYS